MMPPVRFELTDTEKLNFQGIPTWVFKVAQRLTQNHFQAYLVGGAVRDMLWGEEPSDWDLASNALPDQIEQLFSNTIPTGKRFGTITVIYDGYTMEVTSLREDLAYSDGRHPQNILFSQDITADLARRDFTINAMAYDFLTQELIDPFGGKKDARQRLLKAVGDPDRRFHEDGLRMFRFYRFLATLELQAHRPTERAINPIWTSGVSFERIREEFSKLLLGQGVKRGLNGLKKSGLLGSFIPEFVRMSTRDSEMLIQGTYENHLWKHSVDATVAIHSLLHLRLAALLHDIAKPITRTMDKTGVHFYGHDQLGAEFGQTILERLHYPQKMIDVVTELIRWHMFFVDEQTSDSAIRRLIAKVSPEHILDLLELRRADIIATDVRTRRVDYQTWEAWRDLSERITQILSSDNVFNPFQLEINGKDLMEQFKLSPGPFVGEVLSYLKEMILEDPSLNQKPILLELTENYIKSKNN
jgi:tRNA nucleotidyltransferase (CCA-adding enzyme)